MKDVSSSQPSTRETQKSIRSPVRPMRARSSSKPEVNTVQHKHKHKSSKAITLPPVPAFTLEEGGAQPDFGAAPSQTSSRQHPYGDENKKAIVGMGGESRPKTRRRQDSGLGHSSEIRGAAIEQASNRHDGIVAIQGLGNAPSKVHLDSESVLDLQDVVGDLPPAAAICTGDQRGVEGSIDDRCTEPTDILAPAVSGLAVSPSSTGTVQVASRTRRQWREPSPVTVAQPGFQAKKPKHVAIVPSAAGPRRLSSISRLLGGPSSSGPAHFHVNATEALEPQKQKKGTTTAVGRRSKARDGFHERVEKTSFFLDHDQAPQNKRTRLIGFIVRLIS
jgi:hypothetical protein